MTRTASTPRSSRRTARPAVKRGRIGSHWPEPGRTDDKSPCRDRRRRPSDRVLLTPGNASDIKAAKPLLEPLKGSRQLLGDTAYDSDDLQAWLKKRKTGPVIPNKK